MTGMPPAFRDLLLRYNALGRLLPQGDEVDRAAALEDEVTRAGCALVLQEMKQVETRIWAALDAAAAEREFERSKGGRS